VSITFSANEPLAVNSVVVIILGRSALVQAIGSEAQCFTASVQVTSSDPLVMVPFSISFADRAGNSGNTATVTTDGSVVNVAGGCLLLSRI